MHNLRPPIQLKYNVVEKINKRDFKQFVLINRPSSGITRAHEGVEYRACFILVLLTIDIASVEHPCVV